MSMGHEHIGPKPRQFGTSVLVIAVLLGLGVGMLLSSSMGLRLSAKEIELVGGRKVEVAVEPSSLSPYIFVDLAKRVKPGVVNISTTKVVKGGGRVFRQGVRRG